MQVNISGRMQNKPVAVQNGTVLYEKADSALVLEGLHLAELIDVRRFANVFGGRVGLVFRISTGLYAGQEIMESAALSPSPRGKLAELLRGLGGQEPSLLTATDNNAGSLFNMSRDVLAGFTRPSHTPYLSDTTTR